MTKDYFFFSLILCPYQHMWFDGCKTFSRKWTRKQKRKSPANCYWQRFDHSQFRYANEQFELKQVKTWSCKRTENFDFEIHSSAYVLNATARRRWKKISSKQIEFGVLWCSRFSVIILHKLAAIKHICREKGNIKCLCGVSACGMRVWMRNDINARVVEMRQFNGCTKAIECRTVCETMEIL